MVMESNENMKYISVLFSISGDIVERGNPNLM